MTASERIAGAFSEARKGAEDLVAIVSAISDASRDTAKGMDALVREIEGFSD